MVRINSNPPVTEFTIQDALDNARRYVTEIVIPLIAEITHIDLSRLAAFFGSIDFTAPDFDPIDAMFVFVEDVLLPGGLGAAIQVPAQELADFIINALTGNNSNGNPPQAVYSVLSQVRSGLQITAGTAQGALAVAQQVSQLILQVIQKLPQTPTYNPTDLLGAIWFWVGGWFGLTEQSNSNTNPAVVAQQGQIDAIIAQVSAGTETGDIDQFNDSALPKWSVVGSVSKIIASTGTDPHIITSAIVRAGRFSAEVPTTDHFFTQAILRDVYTSASGNVSRIWFAANAAVSNFVCTDIDRQLTGTNITLSTITSGSVTSFGTIRDQYWLDTGKLKESDAITCVRNGTWFGIYWNNQLLNEWTDTGGIIGSGVGNREHGLLTTLANSNSLQGCGFDNYSFGDVT